MKNLFTLFLWVSLSAHGALLNFDNATKLYDLKANNITVPVFDSAIVNLDSDRAEYTLDLTGAGIREKKVFLFKEQTYAAASYVYDIESIDPNKVYESVRKAELKAMHLTVLRYLNAGQIRSSFEEALLRNNIDIETPSVKKILEQINQGIPAGATASFLGYAEEGAQTIIIESPYLNANSTDTHLTDDFWSCWFGLVDGPLGEKLKRNLVSQILNLF